MTLQESGAAIGKRSSRELGWVHAWWGEMMGELSSEARSQGQSRVRIKSEGGETKLEVGEDATGLPGNANIIGVCVWISR